MEPARVPGAGGPLARWREGLVLALALASATALVLVALSPSQDPAAVANARLASESGLVVQAVTAEWTELRGGDALLAGGIPIAWRETGDADRSEAEPVPLPAPSAREATPFDALLAEARRVGGREGDASEGLAIVGEALARPHDAARAAAAHLEAVRYAARVGDGAEAAQAFTALQDEAPPELAEGGVSVRLLALLAGADVLPAEVRASAAERLCALWDGGTLALPRPDPARLPVPAEDPARALRAALAERLAAASAHPPEMRARILRHEERNAGAALVALARPAAGVTAADALAPGTDDRVQVTALADGRELAWRAEKGNARTGAVQPAGTAWSRLAAALSERALVPAGFTVDAQGDASAAGPVVRPRLALAGSDLGFVVRHADPDSLVAGARTRARHLRTALCALALLVAAAGVGAARLLARERALAAARTAFVASVSHELRTPLSSILLLAENLEEGRVTDDARRARYHASIRREAARLRRLVDDVLDLARAERGDPPQARRAEVEVAALAGRLEQEIGERAAAAGGAVRFRVNGVPARAWVDADALARAAGNLVENALVHGSPADEAVEVTLGGDRAGGLRLVVRDHGPGVPRARRERLFAPFARGGRRDPARPGAGLGLAIVREVAAAHGGSARFVDPPDGRGAQVELDLPGIPEEGA